VLTRKFYLITSIFLLTSIAQAQEVVGGVEVLRNSNGRVWELKPAQSASKALATNAVRLTPPTKAESLQSVTDFLSTNKDLIGLSSPATELASVKVKDDDSGRHFRLRQSYKGLPVYGAEVLGHLNANGEVTSVTTNVATNLPKSVKPVVSKRLAKFIALREARSEPGVNLKLLASAPELQILALDLVKGQGEPDSRLAFKVVVNDSRTKGEMLYSSNFWIDAVSGRVLFKSENHEGMTREVRDCATDPNNNGCSVDTLDAQFFPPNYYHGRSEGAPVRGPNPNSLIMGPVPFNNQPYYLGSVDVDTLWSMLGQLHSYVFTSFGLNGGNNAGGIGIPIGTNGYMTRGLVHADHGGSNFCPYGYAIYSLVSGSVQFCKGAVVNDVVGHEYAHSMVYATIPGGPSLTGETGALNESHSDIQGEAFEYAMNGVLDFKLGRFASFGTTRDVANPPSVNRSYDGLPFPDRNYSSYRYCGTSLDSGGVHINSTIPSKAFYLISQGGEFNGCDIQGQGIEVAKQLYWKAWDVYFTQTETFSQAYSHIITACNARYSASVCAEVSKALQAVELNQAGPCVTPSPAPEAAPACATHREGSPVTTNGVYYWQTTQYAPGEHIFVRSGNAAPGKTVKVYQVPHSASAPVNWAPLSGTAVTATVDGTGLLSAAVGTASTEGTFDLIVDGNNDGFYQPWADTLATITVKKPVDGDGVCFRGENYNETAPITENCFISPLDCACAPGNSCNAINWNGTPTHMCFQPVVYQSPS